ncbi:DUF7507 domain-containing protein [Plantibacter sp. Mn2098]|uniref:DUF7507 domain-containing protein n=1 Tax=Plantibacter sp. Mn2098 TaxID=3395266 RepID=UPI003BDDEE90
MRSSTRPHTAKRRRIASGRVIGASAALTVAFAALGAAPASAAEVEFPYTNDFSSTDGGTLSGDATISDGWLKLTPNATFKAGSWQMDDTFSTDLGIDVTFDYSTYGGSASNGGNGLSFFLSDGAAPQGVGAQGAALGYAAFQRNASSAGLPGGFLGVGIDEYGAFSSDPAFNSNAPAPLRNSIALRGSGNELAGYDYLTRAASPGGISTGARATPHTVRVIVAPDSNGDLMVDVWKNRGPGTPLEQVISDVDLTSAPGQADLPDTLRIGFGAGTGSAWNAHEISEVKVSVPTDLSISQTAPASVEVDGTITYSVVASNESAIPVNGATISDILPSSVSNVTWTCTDTNGTCGEPSGTGNTINTTVDLPANGSVTYTISGTVHPTASIEHTATITEPANRNEIDSSNNTTTATTSVTDRPITVSNLPTTDTQVAAGSTTDIPFLTSGGSTPAGAVDLSWTSDDGIPFSTNTIREVDAAGSRTITGELSTDGTRLTLDDYAGVWNDASPSRDLYPTATIPADAQPGETFSFTTEVSTNPGYSNTATTTTTTNEYTVTVENPSVETSSSITWDDANGNGIPDAGEPVETHANVTNTGITPLTDVRVTDGLDTALGCDVTTLDPGQSIVCASSAPHALTQAEIDAGSLTTTFALSATTPAGTPFTGTIPSATLTLEAAASGTVKLDADTDGEQLKAGDIVTYTTSVTNQGNVTLNDLTARNSLATGDATATATSLAPGAVATLTSTFEVTQDVLDSGEFTNDVEVSAMTPGGAPVTLGSDSVLTVVPERATVDLTVNGDRLLTAVGENAVFTATLENTGNRTLTDLSIVDGEAHAFTCDQTSLAPGERVECTITVTVTEAHASSGSIRATASGTALTPAGTTVEFGPEEANIPVVPLPIALAMTGAGGLVPAGIASALLLLGGAVVLARKRSRVEVQD